MDAKVRFELDALLKQTRLSGKQAFVGIINQRDGSSIAVLLAEQPFVFKALKLRAQNVLIEYLYLNWFTRFDKVVVIDHFSDPVAQLAIMKLGAKVPVIITQSV